MSISLHVISFSCVHRSSRDLMTCPTSFHSNVIFVRHFIDLKLVNKINETTHSYPCLTLPSCGKVYSRPLRISDFDLKLHCYMFLSPLDGAHYNHPLITNLQQHHLPQLHHLLCGSDWRQSEDPDGQRQKPKFFNWTFNLFLLLFLLELRGKGDFSTPGPCSEEHSSSRKIL